MDITGPIRRSFADEHVLAVDPPLRPDLPGVWRRRINPFAGRALSDKALTAEQDLRSGLSRILGLARAPGVVAGLEIDAEPGAIGALPAQATLRLAAGMGLTRFGEDIGVGREVRLPLGGLAVALRRDHDDLLKGGAAPADAGDEAGDETARLRPARPRLVGDRLAAVAANPASAALPHVAVLVARPVAVDILGSPPGDCGIDPRDDAYADLQRIDGAELLLYLWPAEVTAAAGPDYALPPDGAAFRNRLAHAVFDVERLFSGDDMHPWEEWGLPLALLGFDAGWRLAFVDRHAVRRQGGRPRSRTPLVAASGNRALAQARTDQFVGQLADLPALDAATLASALPRLPPVGVLPAELFDPALRRQQFFPASFTVSAIPVPLSNLNRIAAEAGMLASLDRGQPDRVELLVPVADRLYDPDLLQVEVVDPRFQQAIRAITEDRKNWLVRREIGRQRYDALRSALAGRLYGWPDDDPGAIEDNPPPHLEPPLALGRVRRVEAGTAKVMHGLYAAAVPLRVDRDDRLFLWLRIADRTGLAAVVLGIGNAHATEPASDGGMPADQQMLVWGDAATLPAGAAFTRLGDLPQENGWTRLEIPLAALGGDIDGEPLRIDVVTFGQVGGSIEWGPFGSIDRLGQRYTFVGDDAPAGATLYVDREGGEKELRPWDLTPVAGRVALPIPSFGTDAAAGPREVAALQSFVAHWHQPSLADELRLLRRQGIDTYLSYAEQRLKATNDAVDLGFVRARADIYRVRQIMLGGDAAARLVTSPSLADLAVRDEGARATAKGIAAYLESATSRSPTPAAPVAAAPPADSRPATGSYYASNLTRTLNIVGTANIAAVTTSRSAVLAPATTAVFTLPAASQMSMVTGFAPVATVAQPLLAVATPVATRSIAGARMVLDTSRYKASDIQAQLPIAGLVERTISVAERLQPAPAVQALDYALASKAAVVETLVSLAASEGGMPKGVPLLDVPLAGYSNGDKVPTLAEWRDDSSNILDTDQLPDDGGDRHEANYFTNAVQAMDNAIAIMRLVEGRVALFGQFVDELKEVRLSLLASIDEAAAWLRSTDVEVEEARHDFATAERLFEEEQTRVEVTNSRRADILEHEVKAILWRRSRTAGAGSTAAAMEMSPGLAPAPVATCLGAHNDVPDEIHDYVQLLRDAPLAWFPAVAAAVNRIDRLDSARLALARVQQQAGLAAAVAAAAVPAAVVAAAPRLLQTARKVAAAQQAVVVAGRTLVARTDIGAITSLSLAQLQVRIAAAATLGDALDGTHRQPLLTRAAASEIDGITSIAGCLYEQFCTVAPVVRLFWAELLSEFDDPAPLRQLSALPKWGEVPLALRRSLQEFVDWLFSRIDNGAAPAVSAMNELVRVALLMAAASPVDRLISARPLAPVPAQPGAHLQLALDPGRLRVGMLALIRDADDRIVSRARVADLASGTAQLAITSLVADVRMIGPEHRVELLGGTS